MKAISMRLEDASRKKLFREFVIGKRDGFGSFFEQSKAVVVVVAAFVSQYQESVKTLIFLQRLIQVNRVSMLIRLQREKTNRDVAIETWCNYINCNRFPFMSRSVDDSRL